MNPATTSTSPPSERSPRRSRDSGSDALVTHDDRLGEELGAVTEWDVRELREAPAEGDRSTTVSKGTDRAVSDLPAFGIMDG